MMLKKIKFYLKNSKIIGPYYFKLREFKRITINKYYSKFLHRNGLEALMVLKKVCNELNIEFFLDASTLLGAIREKNFIKGDNDLGIGIELQNYSKSLEETLNKNGVKLVIEYFIDDKKYGLQQTYIYKNVEIDIMYHKHQGAETIYHGFIDHPQVIDGYAVKEYHHPFAGLEKIIFLGEEFNIPKNPKIYLKALYGEDWMIPKPNWSMADEKGNIILKNKVGKSKKYSN